MEHLNKAEILEQAIRALRFKDLRVEQDFVGPKGKIKLRRESCIQDTRFRAEVSVREVATTALILTLSWNRKEGKWDPDWNRNRHIIERWNDQW